MVFALLIHSVANLTMENNSKDISLTYSQEECLISQARPIHNALERLYNYYSTQSCDLGHTDIAQVPAEKSIQLLISYFREYKSMQRLSYDDTHRIPKFSSDPITHYIYGLRKIII